ncbi:hypothetical protein F3Y22_tig00110151pilonHSYRG00102 [Hibiscus syriacus]|uniref:Uncharacterized protein n=1 Tax=Hibiscus syriacus TaxID=106335 RepID=A0A6A3BK28_HIBSY|nr:hypothetical protein F3Y22_tig00110151pilonHSYRG00102 [Hibiscus syriacus]
MEQCRQGKSAKWIHILGRGLVLRVGHGGPSPELVGCRCIAETIPAAKAGHRVLIRGRTGNGSFGVLPRETNSQLRIVKKFNQAQVKGGSNYDSLKNASKSESELEVTHVPVARLPTRSRGVDPQGLMSWVLHAYQTSRGASLECNFYQAAARPWVLETRTTSGNKHALWWGRVDHHHAPICEEVIVSPPSGIPDGCLGHPWKPQTSISETIGNPRPLVWEFCTELSEPPTDASVTIDSHRLLVREFRIELSIGVLHRIERWVREPRTALARPYGPQVRTWIQEPCTSWSGNKPLGGHKKGDGGSVLVSDISMSIVVLVCPSSLFPPLLSQVIGRVYCGSMVMDATTLTVGRSVCLTMSIGLFIPTAGDALLALIGLVCDALRCSGLYARCTDVFNESIALADKPRTTREHVIKQHLEVTWLCHCPLTPPCLGALGSLAPVCTLNYWVARPGVSESRDIVEGLAKELSFLFNGLPTLETTQTEISKVNNIGKGSWQNGSATSRKGLAMRDGHEGLSPEPVGCRCIAQAVPTARAGYCVPIGGWTRNGSFRGFLRAMNTLLRTVKVFRESPIPMQP